MMILSTVTFESRASIWPLGWPSRSPLANDIWGWLSYALFHAWFEIFLPDISSSHWFWNIWFEDSTVLFQTVRRFLIQWIVRIWFLNKYLYILEDCHQAVDFWIFYIFLFRPSFSFLERMICLSWKFIQKMRGSVVQRWRNTFERSRKE